MSLAELRRELVETRRRGWAREDGSVTLGFSSVATAVLDHNGYPQAAVALTFPTDEVDEARHEELAVRVIDTSARIARHIRGRTPR